MDVGLLVDDVGLLVDAALFLLEAVGDAATELDALVVSSAVWLPELLVDAAADGLNEK